MGNRLLSPTNAGDKSHDESPCKCPDDDANKLPRVEARNKDIEKVRLTLHCNFQGVIITPLVGLI